MNLMTQRIDPVKLLSDEQRRATPPVPKRVLIELTARCDFRCFFCASHTRPREKSDMPWWLYTRIVKELRELGVEQLGVFFLGESFLCDWLPEAIRYAKRDCGYPHVFLTTNGRLATAERVRECMLAGLDSLKFGFNFSGPGQFHDVTRMKADEYHTVVNNIKDARWMRDYVEVSTGHRCGLCASSLLYDDKQRDRMEEVIGDILPYVDEHDWVPLYGYAGLPHSARHASAACEGGKQAPRKPLPCAGPFVEGHITCDGRLSACSLDHNPRYQMGNLRHMSFAEAWRSEPFQRLREAHLAKNVSGTACEKCIAY